MPNGNIDLTQVSPDFWSIVDALQTDLKNRPDAWKDIYAGGTGETLIEYLAAVAEMNQWSIEQAAKEAYLATATRDTSIYSIARMLGVRISRKLPGINTVMLKRKSLNRTPISGVLLIPKFSQFSIQGIPFFNRSNIYFSSQSDTIDNVLLYQGRVYSKSYTSSGAQFQQLVLPSLNKMSISDADIYVVVNGESWTTVYDGLWHYGSGAKIVADNTLGNGDVILQFGDGYNGTIPPQGSTITVYYVETLGSKLELLPAGSKVSLNEPISNQSVTGSLIKQNLAETVDSTLASLPLTLSNINSALPQATLPVGSTWLSAHIGLHLEDNTGGMAVILSIKGATAKLAVVTEFQESHLAAGMWRLTLPSTGQDEKPAAFYKLASPYLFRANGRAVTPEDHSAICKSYPGVSDVLVRFERDLIQSMRINITGVTPGIEGVDYVITSKDPHPQLMNVIWISVLPETGVAWTTLAWKDFLDWFAQYQYAGSIIRSQNPIKQSVGLNIKIYCRPNTDLMTIQTRSEIVIRDIFATNKPMLGKRVALSDIAAALRIGIVEIDYVTINKPLTDFVPTPSTVHQVTGMPSPPSYLSLTDLNIEMYFTDRL